MRTAHHEYNCPHKLNGFHLDCTCPAPTERDHILNALQAFIRQRPGMDPRNYDYAGYQSERRQVHQDLEHAEKLLGAVRWRTGITAEKLKEAFKGAFSRRLSWEEHPSKPGYWHIDYCTGQYFPTEYRKAVCTVLASALWDYWREGYMSAREHLPDTDKHKGAAMGIRMSARKEFGLTIAKRYFDYRPGDYR